jgi:acetoin utilization deacetylase AcuC-like enzyme
MNEILKKLKKDFLEIDPEISIQKAFETLANPDVNILIYMNPDFKYFHYITGKNIHHRIKQRTELNKILIKDVAIRSLVFDLNRYEEIKSEYIKYFKKSLLKLESKLPLLILVISNKKPIGLVSDLVVYEIPDTRETTFKSKLDIFLESSTNPIENIDKFFIHLTDLGFNLTPELKEYIINLMQTRLIQNNRKQELLDSSSKTVSEEIKPDKIVSIESPQKTGIAGKIIITYNPSHINHRPVGSSPEAPERITKIIELLKDREKVFNDNCILSSDYESATEEDLLRVHTKQYIQFVKEYAKKGGGFLGDSTYITNSTHNLALLAIGGAIRAAEEVINGKAEFGFGLIRPPGHHASREKYGGYCIYNNAAVLARYLQTKKKMEKILILDWDAHAANGTMDIFYDDPTVMLISLHQDPHNYYPKTGFISQLGKSNGIGYTVNVEMPRGSGNEEYMTVFNKLVIPLYEKFNPDFVIGCNGFDTHHSDTYTDLNLTAEGYYKFCSIFREKMRNKMVILMEGGYNPYMGELTHTIINGLLGLPNPFEDKYLSLVSKVISDEKTYLILNQKLKELKFNLSRYHIL